ncbi:outer membrane beta-barrel protein [Brasilonema bromeliae]|uniref:Outer membrane protein beta-barrel domain-containing protein n=1 Tax=Brasilonema bromeliae SPC951 TaxID=385972 RepID=A0ABX1P788_9CYAN|nr:outer membrane beta-barrel protein [Brasilonema bromeliae]NMG20277.1 hypothetical protein [Brasilonema bromeliae SPC951]
MKRLLKSFVTISALSSVVVAPILLSAGLASALPRPTQNGTDASYVGVGVSGGLTNGGQKGDAAAFGGNVTGRYKLGDTPLSARGQLLWGEETTAIIPQISADLGIGKGTNIYLGAGYSFVEKDGKASPLGNKDGVALTAGVESELGNSFMLYGNANLGVDAYKNSPASAFNVSGGVGYRFR